MTEDTSLTDFASSGSNGEGGGDSENDREENDDRDAGDDREGACLSDDRVDSASGHAGGESEAVLEAGEVGGALADGESDEALADEAVTEVDSTEPPSDSADGDPVAGVTPTTTFARGDYECATCDRTTERVWRDDGEYVCPSCKRW